MPIGKTHPSIFFIRRNSLFVSPFIRWFSPILLVGTKTVRPAAWPKGQTSRRETAPRTVKPTSRSKHQDFSSLRWRPATMKSNDRHVLAFPKNDNALTRKNHVRWPAALLVVLLSWLCFPSEAQAGKRDRKPPSVPTNLTATAVSCSQIDISWGSGAITLAWSPSTDVGTSGLMGYRLYTNNVFYKQVLAPATSISHTGLVQLRTYTYTIQSIDKAGNRSAMSPPVSATTPSCCTFALAPSSATAGAGGGGGNISVTTASTCAWTPTSSAAWLTISPTGARTGGGSLGWTATANTTASARIGQLNIGGQIFSLTQAGASPTISLGDALDYTALSWTSGGNSNWIGQTSIFYSGGDSAQAGLITHSQNSWFQATVTGPVDLSFFWKVSSEQNYDFLSFAIDGVNQASVSGEVNWQQRTFSVPSGTHTLRWTYAKDSVVSVGMDCGWVDQIQITAPVVVVCSYAVTPSSPTIAGSGGPGSASVTASSSTCTWSASSGANWITITAGNSGAGNGAVSYSVAANNTCSPRQGTLTVTGLSTPQTVTHTVYQAAGSGNYSISPTGANILAAGGPGSVSVGANSGCGWLATVESSGSGWISITSGNSGSGPGTVYYSVSANANSSQRSGTLTIAGRPFTVTQAGAAVTCTYALSPTSANPDAAARSGAFTVSTGPTCPWTPVSSAPSWLTFTPASGIGSGTVTWYASANTSTNPRSGSLSITGQTFTVTQAGMVEATGGQMQWLRTTSGGTATATGIKTDHLGNVIVVGRFTGPMDFGSGPVSSANSSFWSIFIAKYTAQNRLLWVKSLGNADYSAAQSVAVDSADNVIVGGYFGQTVDFGGVPLTSVGSYDLFVAKYSPSGASIWAKRFGGYGSDGLMGMALAVDASDNVALATPLGWTTTADFGSIILTNAGASDLAVAKLSSGGTTLWAKRWGGMNGEVAHGLAVDRSGDVVVIGELQGNTTDLGGGPMSATGIINVFLAKYSGADGSYRWSKLLGTVDNNYGYGVATDPNTGNVIVTGGFTGIVDFGGGPIGAGTSNGGVFLAGYGPSGNYLWAKATGGVGNAGFAVSIDANGNLALTGNCPAVYFGGSQYLVGNGYFVARFTISGNSPPDYRWAKLATTGSGSAGYGIASDTLGHVLTAGWFKGTTDFGGLSADANVVYPSAFIIQYNQ
jgi:hypothetical protein